MGDPQSVYSTEDVAIRSTFPNPLNIGFGRGRILVSTYRSLTGRGLLLWQSDEDHEVGAYANEQPEPNHKPRPGEVYLDFANIESARVFAESALEVVSEWEKEIQQAKEFDEIE